ncbi:MAG: hypothetical protein QOE92_396, partial [Chloroflexota bacterium]|nr:hypothetical protein [Chloroflexota bacterium]
MAKRQLLQARTRRPRLAAASSVLAGMGIVGFLSLTTPSGLAASAEDNPAAPPDPKKSASPSPTPCGRFIEEPPYFASCVSPSPSII